MARRGFVERRKGIGCWADWRQDGCRGTIRQGDTLREDAVDIDGVAELLKQVREAAAFLLNIPEKLISLVPDIKISYLGRKERIRVLKDVVELREFGKDLQELYFFKGDLVEFVRDHIGSGLNAIDDQWKIEMLKGIFCSAGKRLEEVRATIKDMYFGQTAVALEAILFLAKASAIYRRLSELPDAELRDSEHLVEICSFIQGLSECGLTFVEQLDEYRKQIDYTYGD